MRVVFYWEKAGLSLDRANPYGALLAQALAKVGVTLEAGFDLDARWLEEYRGRVQVLHLNWPHHLYRSDTLEASVERCSRFVEALHLARRMGYRIVWTVHNLYPHERPFPEIDRIGRLALVQAATALIVHCHYAAEEVRRHFYREERVFVIPHGNFIVPYPNETSRAEARRQVGIPEGAFVYLFFGNARPYKGLERLIDAFCALPRQDVRLLLAFRPFMDYSKRVEAEARVRDSRIVVRISPFFANEEVQVFFNAADVAVMPFQDILTSGSVITALSFGKPVIVPGIGCLPELVGGEMGIVYDAQEAGALRQAMEAIQDMDVTAMGAAAFQRALTLDWDDIARKTAEVYRVE